MRDIKGGAILELVIESGASCLDDEVRDDSSDCVAELGGLRGTGGDVGRALGAGGVALAVAVMLGYDIAEDAGELNVDLNLEINEDIIDVSSSSSSLKGFALYSDVISSREPREYEDCTEPSPRATSIAPMTAGGKIQNARARALDALDARRSIASRFAPSLRLVSRYSTLIMPHRP